VHPYHGPVTGASTTINYPEPENLAAAAESFLRAYATATDSKGHATTVTQALRPLKVQLQFATVPQGGRVVLEGTRYRTPKAVTSWAGHVFPVGVPDQRIDGKDYVFKSWSDGGARRHDIVTPTTPTNYVATLRPK